MANTANRGGKKQDSSRAAGQAKKTGVRPGSTAARKERGQQGPRQPTIEPNRGS
jgi:hypothetical protein